MKIDILNIPQNTKHIKPLDFKKIRIKSSFFEQDFIVSEDLEKLIFRMVKTCLLDDGVGLAAPQIGTFKQLFIIKDIGDNNIFNCYFNPKYTPIIKNGKSSNIEGCLSVSKTFNILRWNSIDAEYISLDQNKKSILIRERMDGYLARIFQHEYDHLQGLSISDLFIRQNK